MTRVVIAGSRNYTDKQCLFDFCKGIIDGIHDEIEIISGHCSGADMLGEEFANTYGYNLTCFPADWKTHGRAAGPIRNRQMAEYANEFGTGILIAFPLGESRGTQSMINEARKIGMGVYVND